MQISPITNNNTNFKGMWGETTYMEGTDNANMVDYYWTIRKYYPYKDETKEEIKKVEEKYSKYDVSPEHPNWDQYQTLYEEDVRVQEPLDFTKVDYYNAMATKYEILLKQDVSKEAREQSESILKTVEEKNLTTEPKKE